tara:strand:+ start:19 stop:423 length:405 start_codon:yes stop_codon:yes gene_type:complete
MDTIAIVGKIAKILPLELKGANKDFKVQSMILTVDKSYKKDGMTVSKEIPLKVDFKQKNVELIKNFKVGDKVLIDWNLEGSEWQGVNMETPIYFVSVEVWKIAHYIEDTNAVQNLNPFPTTDAPLKQGTDDLPF